MTTVPRPTTPSLPGRASPAKASLAPKPELPDYLPARMLNEFVYCPRLFYYEWVEGVFAHSADTVEGSLRHERVDAKSDALPSAGDAAATDAPVVARSVELASETLRLLAKMDLVELDGGAVTPVDYKKGRPRDGEDGPEAWPADRTQIAAQAMILREHGYACAEGVLYYSATKQRVRVVLTDEVVAETTAVVQAAREAAAGAAIPPPLVDSPKCPRCSLVGICLPDETVVVEARRPDDASGIQPWLIPPDDRSAAGDGPAQCVRRLVPARDDLRPLYVLGQGMTVGKSGDVLQVRDRERKVVQEARLIDVSQVNLFGNVTMSAPAVQALAAADKPIAYMSTGGWFYGMLRGLGDRNAYLRAEQFRRADQPAFCRAVASRTVAAKIRNQRTMLQRNHVEPPARAIDQLKRQAITAEETASIEQLLGVEGMAARAYFEAFSGMIKADDELGTFSFEHRNRRPPRDPINALLSLAYSLLAKDLTVICATVGLDPFWGFYHQPRFGRPALALDLMEMFRPLIADSAVITAVNTGMVAAKEVVRAGGAVSLTPDGRKGLIRAYEQRMDGLVTHPVFDYRVSYRRVLEIQARLLARFIAGEIEDYPSFETR